MIYRVRHITIYDYEDPVSVSHHVLRLTPRNLPRQRCSESQIAIAPAPPSWTTRTDYFGNVLTFFTLREPHGRLTVEASSELEVQNVEAPDFSRSPHWETVQHWLEGDTSVEVLDAYQHELERSKQPGYVPPSLDHEDIDFDDDRTPNLRLRPTGTGH